MKGFDDGTHLFLVRVWRQVRGFRASVRTLDEQEPRLFSKPEQVGEFLSQSVAARDDATPSTTDATPKEL